MFRGAGHIRNRKPPTPWTHFSHEPDTLLLHCIRDPRWQKLLSTATLKLMPQVNGSGGGMLNKLPAIKGACLGQLRLSWLR
jgi:hypothetical protein